MITNNGQFKNKNQQLSYVLKFIDVRQIITALGKEAAMKYFDIPEQNAAFMRYIDILAAMIEKYGGNIVFPAEEEMKESWDNLLQSIQYNNAENNLTIEPAA